MAAFLTAGGEPRLAGLLARRAHIHLQQHLQKGQLDELDQAIATLQVAVHLAKSSLQRVHLGSMLNMLGVLFLRRYAHNANEAVLDDSLHRFSWALECFSDSHPQRVIALAGVAQVRASRYDRTGAMLDLEEAISQMQTATCLQRFFNDTDLLAITLSNLGCVLWRRYQRTGSSENLHEALDAMTKAATAVSPDNAELLGSIWTNLAGLLARQHEITGMLEHLGNAVFEAHEVAHAAPESRELDSLLGLLGELARCEYARRVPISRKTTTPLLSFYIGSLVLSIVVSLFVVSYSHFKMLLYPIVFLIGICCSGVTSQLYQENREGSRLSRCRHTRIESSNMSSEAIPKILDLPLFDDSLFETIQTESRFEKDAPTITHPVNIAQTDDCTITEREDVHGNNENKYHPRSTRHVLNKSRDSSFHGGVLDQTPRIEKQTPITAVSKSKPKKNTPNDAGNSSNSVESDRTLSEMEQSKLHSIDVKPAQKEQAQTVNTAPAHVDTEQAPEEDPIKAVAEPKLEASERIHNVNVTGKLTFDPSSYIAPEQPSNIHLPSSSSTMRPPGGGAQNTAMSENTPHAPASRNAGEKGVELNLRNFDLPNPMSQQGARTGPQEPIAADQGSTTHDIHKNEGNAMGNLFSQRAEVVGHISRHYGDKHEVNHYMVAGDSTSTKGAKRPTALFSQLPPSDASPKSPSEITVSPPSFRPFHYRSSSSIGSLTKSLVPYPQKNERLLDKSSNSGSPHKTNAGISPRTDKQSTEKSSFDQERTWFPHVGGRSRRAQNFKKWNSISRGSPDESPDESMYIRLSRPGDTRNPEPRLSEPNSSPFWHRPGYSSSPPRDKNENPTGNRTFGTRLPRRHRFSRIPKRSTDRASPLDLASDSDNLSEDSDYRAVRDYIRRSQGARREHRPVSRQQEAQYDSAKEYMRENDARYGAKTEHRPVSERRKSQPYSAEDYIRETKSRSPITF